MSSITCSLSLHPTCALARGTGRFSARSKNQGRKRATVYLESVVHVKPKTPRATQAVPIQGGKRASLPRCRRGFTLIEILVVIVIIAILASLVAPSIFQNVGAAKDATARSQIEMLGAALDAYRLDNGKYPPTALGLEALNTKPTDESASNWRGPYLRKALPLDPWRHPYIYKAPGEVNPRGYDLLSYGADGQPGGEGENADIVSWK